MTTKPSSPVGDVQHTGPGTAAGAYLRQFWQPVLISSELPVGRPLPIRIMGEDLTLYRGRSGKPYVVQSRCPHRLTLFSTGWVEDDCIRCLYHGWKFDGDGNCVEQPAEDPAFAHKVRILSYPAQEYLGLVFVFFGHGQPPPLPRYPEFEGPGVLTNSSYLRKCNYFQNLENLVDEVHVAFTHRYSTYGERGLFEVPNVSAVESDWGVTMYAQRTGERVRVTQLGMPNVVNVKTLPGAIWEDMIGWRVPVDDESHVSFSAYFADVTGVAAEAYRAQDIYRPDNAAGAVAERFLRGELTHTDIEGQQNTVAVQDSVAQLGQGVMVDHARERLGRSDVGIILLRKIWSREMRALGDGRPLKQWQRTEKVRVAAGAT